MAYQRPTFKYSSTPMSPERQSRLMQLAGSNPTTGGFAAVDPRMSTPAQAGQVQQYNAARAAANPNIPQVQRSNISKMSPAFPGSMPGAPGSETQVPFRRTAGTGAIFGSTGTPNPFSSAMRQPMAAGTTGSPAALNYGGQPQTFQSFGNDAIGPRLSQQPMASSSGGAQAPEDFPIHTMSGGGGGAAPTAGSGGSQAPEDYPIHTMSSGGASTGGSISNYYVPPSGYWQGPAGMIPWQQAWMQFMQGTPNAGG